MRGLFSSLASDVGSGSFFGTYSQQEAHVYFSGCLYGESYIKSDRPEKQAAQRVWELFKQESLKGLTRLDGSFLVIIQTPLVVYVFRDRHGTGPSFYYSGDQFSTSLYELTQAANTSLTPDIGALSDYFRIGYVPVPRTSFSEIKKLAGGSVLSHQVNTKEQTATSLFTYEDFVKPESSLSLDELSEMYGSLHSRAIQKRMEGQHSVGILLSGGYDSGSNLLALRKQWQGDIQSFSIGFKGNHWSELPVAREMSSIYDTKHSEYELDGSEICFLPDIVKALGDPFVEGGLMVNYAAMKMAAQDRPEMILGGDGSDQYFGTSGREVSLHLLIRKYGLYHPLVLLTKNMDRDYMEKDGLLFRLRYHLKRITNIQGGDQFGFSEQQIRALIANSKGIPANRIQKPLCENFNQLYSLNHFDCAIKKTIDQVILYKASKMAEAFHNHLSFPYLDNELFQFLQTVPVHYKCRGNSVYDMARGHGTAKFLLKYHYKPFLPASVTSKKKQGGFAPMALFFNDPAQRHRLSEFILESDICRDFLNRDVVAAWLKSYDKESNQDPGWFWYQQGRSFQFFNLLSLAVWWQIFVARKHVASL